METFFGHFEQFSSFLNTLSQKLRLLLECFFKPELEAFLSNVRHTEKFWGFLKIFSDKWRLVFSNVRFLKITRVLKDISVELKPYFLFFKSKFKKNVAYHIEKHVSSGQVFEENPLLQESYSNKIWQNGLKYYNHEKEKSLGWKDNHPWGCQNYLTDGSR
jgi:hypothetical protein